MSMSSFTIPEKDLIIEVQDELVIDSMIKEGKIEFDEVTFGGRLNATQADRMVGTPGIKDRRLFEQSLSATRSIRLLEAPMIMMSKERKQRKRNASESESGGSLIQSLSAPPRIEILHFGRTELNPWYGTPLPAEYFEGPEMGHIWMCEYCLKFMRSRESASRHELKCFNLPPPGREIYRKGQVSIFEVNGRFSKEYCQRLCLLAKMFLDHKTLYYDVETFLFYILVEWSLPSSSSSLIVKDDDGKSEYLKFSLVGYFSKEKQSPSEYNLSCIMTLPHYQRQGYGAFLIDFSYLLSKSEGKLGTPEKPLSDLGLLGYVKYWTRSVLEVIISLLSNHSHFGTGTGTDTNGGARFDYDTNTNNDARSKGKVSILQICKSTGMTINDVLATLEYLQIIIWKDFNFEINLSPNLLTRYHQQAQQPPRLKADPDCLRWVPYKCFR